MSLKILPLAITMMAGPQIMSAIIFVTHERALAMSLAFLTGVAVATTIGVALATALAAALGGAVSLGESSDRGSAGTIIQMALVGLLVAAAVRNYLGRKTAEPPKWLGSLLAADPAKALRIGLLVILVMPSDVLVMLTVGTNLEHEEAALVSALPFIGATLLVAALPLLFFLLFHRRAESAMPRVREWMSSQSWLVNIIVCVLFIALVLSG